VAVSASAGIVRSAAAQAERIATAAPRSAAGTPDGCSWVYANPGRSYARASFLPGILLLVSKPRTAIVGPAYAGIKHSLSDYARGRAQGRAGMAAAEPANNGGPTYRRDLITPLTASADHFLLIKMPSGRHAA
jgi:hypothetical protein